MTNTKKRPEVLVPAGTLEKLKVAVNYGADAVFVGGQAYGLRSRAGNFTMDELREGIEYAHARGVDVYKRQRRVNTRKFGCGLCRGKLIFLNQS